MANLLWEDECFKVVHSRDYVLIRKDFPYEFHSHFKRYSGAKGLVSLFYKKLQPHNQYFAVAMQRVTTEEEYSKFVPQRGKEKYYNVNKGGKR
ncbi:hypothetical protein vBCtySFA67_00051 [Clostridium phage vB_CtyS-FA67]|nr:hypothetical protein vBCtySFA67_00051 [Clostridium phage vB_CtyS-FA67]